MARRQRTDMVMQASMWVLGVAAVERQLCRSEPSCAALPVAYSYSKRPLARGNPDAADPYPRVLARSRRSFTPSPALPTLPGKNPESLPCASSCPYKNTLFLQNPEPSAGGQKGVGESSVIKSVVGAKKSLSGSTMSSAPCAGGSDDVPVPQPGACTP